MGSVGLSLYLLLASCVFMLDSIDGTPMEPAYVPPAHIQTTVTLAFAKPVVSLRRMRQHKEPVQMRTCL